MFGRNVRVVIFGLMVAIMTSSCGETIIPPTPTPYTAGKSLKLASSATNATLYVGTTDNVGTAQVTLTNISQSIQSVNVTLNTPAGLEIANANQSPFSSSASIVGKSIESDSNIILEFPYHLSTAGVKDYGVYQIQVSVDTIDNENITSYLGILIVPTNYPSEFMASEENEQNGISVVASKETDYIGKFAKQGGRIFEPVSLWLRVENTTDTSQQIDVDFAVADELFIASTTLNMTNKNHGEYPGLILRPGEARFFQVAVGETATFVGTYQVNLTVRPVGETGTLASVEQTVAVYPSAVSNNGVRSWITAFSKDNTATTTQTHSDALYTLTTALTTSVLSRTAPNGILWLKLANTAQDRVCDVDVKTLADIVFHDSGTNRVAKSGILVRSKEERYLEFDHSLASQFDKGEFLLIASVKCDDGKVTEVRQKVIVR